MKKILFWGVIFQTVTAGAQNVGIGTTTPAAKLDIRYTSSISNATLLLYDNNPLNFARLQFQNASGNKYWHMAGFIDDANDANSRLNFYHSVNGDVLSLTGDGKVGIGTVSPQYKLDVAGRIKLRTGTIGNIFTTPGIWFDDYRDGSNRVFLGMKDSIRLGIWGEGTPGAGWAFDFNARTGEVTASEYRYTTPKTYVYSMSGADFRPRDDIDRSVALYSVSGVYMLNGLQGLVAPVHLPNGATVTTFIVYYYDNSPGENLSVNLFSGDHLGIAGLMASLGSSGAPGNSLLITSGIANPVIDNSSKYYYVFAHSATGTWTDFNLRVTRIQINYTMPGPD